MRVYRNGAFESSEPWNNTIPEVRTSADWYLGKRSSICRSLRITGAPGCLDRSHGNVKRNSTSYRCCLLRSPSFFSSVRDGCSVGHPSERTIARTTAVTFAGAAVAVALLFRAMVAARLGSDSRGTGNWFSVEGYSFPLTLLADQLSLPLLALTVVPRGSDCVILVPIPASR